MKTQLNAAVEGEKTDQSLGMDWLLQAFQSLLSNFLVGPGEMSATSET